MAHVGSPLSQASLVDMLMLVHWQAPSASVLPLCMLDRANIAAVRQVAPSLVLDGTVPAVPAVGGGGVVVVVVVVVDDAAVVVESSAGVRSCIPGVLRGHTPLEASSACSQQNSWALTLCREAHR